MIGPTFWLGGAGMFAQAMALSAIGVALVSREPG